MKTTAKGAKKASGTKTVKKCVAVEKATEKRTRQKERELDFFSAMLTANQMASLLGLTPQALGAAAKKGTLERDAEGKFELAKTVRAYCENLRNRNDAERSASTEGAEFEFWRTQKVKQQSLEGRSQICEEILSTLLKLWRGVGEKIQGQLAPGLVSDSIKKIFDSFEEMARGIDWREVDDFTQEDLTEGEHEAEEGQDDI